MARAVLAKLEVQGLLNSHPEHAVGGILELEVVAPLFAAVTRAFASRRRDRSTIGGTTYSGMHRKALNPDWQVLAVWYQKFFTPPTVMRE